MSRRCWTPWPVCCTAPPPEAPRGPYRQLFTNDVMMASSITHVESATMTPIAAGTHGLVYICLTIQHRMCTLQPIHQQSIA
jgi:hypothetical protein